MSVNHLAPKPALGWCLPWLGKLHTRVLNRRGLKMATRLLNAYYVVDEGLIEELSRVSLTQSVHTDKGVLPYGASGTVVSVYGKGEAYCVEFVRPFHALVTVGSAQVRALAEATRERLITDASTDRHRSK